MENTVVLKLILEEKKMDELEEIAQKLGWEVDKVISAMLDDGIAIFNHKR